MVLTLHGSAEDVGWLNAARFLVGTDVVQTGLLLSIPLMWWWDRLSLPVLMLIVFAYLTASVVNGAAAMSLVPRLVEARHLQRAHARIDGADAVSRSS